VQHARVAKKQVGSGTSHVTSVCPPVGQEAEYVFETVGPKPLPLKLILSFVPAFLMMDT